MSARIERTLSALLTIAAVLIAAAIVKREFFPRSSVAILAGMPGPLEFDPEWPAMLDIAQPSGPIEAPAVLVEFGDLECPACASFHRQALQSARQEFGNQLDVRFVHWPLPNHRFAQAAAEAAECAGKQGRFLEFLDAVFPKQDSIGLKSWIGFGAEAGVPDSAAFRSCLQAPGDLRMRIDSGIATAVRYGFFGTPTIMVNGWKFATPPTAARLSEVVRDIIAGREPKK